MNEKNFQNKPANKVTKPTIPQYCVGEIRRESFGNSNFFFFFFFVKLNRFLEKKLKTNTS